MGKRSLNESLNSKLGLVKWKGWTWKEEWFGMWCGRKVMPTVQNGEVKLVYVKHQKTNKMHENNRIETTG